MNRLSRTHESLAMWHFPDTRRFLLGTNKKTCVVPDPDGRDTRDSATVKLSRSKVYWHGWAKPKLVECGAPAGHKFAFLNDDFDGHKFGLMRDAWCLAQHEREVLFDAQSPCSGLACSLFSGYVCHRGLGRTSDIASTAKKANVFSLVTDHGQEMPCKKPLGLSDANIL